MNDGATAGRWPARATLDERDLARRFAGGDPAAVHALYDRYAGPVLTVVFSRLRDRRLAEEVVQDVFVKAWRAAARFDPDRGGFGPWLYEIARRATTDALRREGRRPPTSDLSDSMPVAEDASLVDVWEAWEVRVALHDLGDDERELIRLTHYLGLTQSQIAQRLDMPLGTVKSRMHRAHRRLAHRLAHLRPAG